MPDLRRELLMEILDTFDNYADTLFDDSDEDEEGQQLDEKMKDLNLGSELLVETKDFKILVSMLMSLGCECTVERAIEIYEAITGKKRQGQDDLKRCINS